MPDSVFKELPVKFQSFSDMDQVHRVADQIFIEHQVACIQGNWDTAFEKMETMYELCLQNILDEEEILLPLYQSVLNEIPKGGAIKFFMREHKRIKQDLQIFIRKMSDIVLYESGSTIDLVKLFEDYHTFKDLLDHHDSRERVFLFKLLDENVHVGNRDSVLEKINARQAELKQKMDMLV